MGGWHSRHGCEVCEAQPRHSVRGGDDEAGHAAYNGKSLKACTMARHGCRSGTSEVTISTSTSSTASRLKGRPGRVSVLKPKKHWRA